MTHIEIDASDADRELGRVDNVPQSVHLELEAVLAAAFAATQEEVHVITGSLQNSGRLESDLKSDTWQGEITYGGPSAGAENNPVEYAQHEQGRQDSNPDGHDFMRPAYRFDDRFGKIVTEFVKGSEK